MNKIFSIILSGVALLSASACSEIKDGTTDIDSWPMPGSETVYDPQVYDLTKHPCMLHTRADIDYVKAHLGQQPWADSYQKLLTSGYSNNGRTATTWEYLARLDATNWAEGGGRWKDAGLEDLYKPGIQNSYMDLARDAAAAYQLSLKWQLSGDEGAAATAVKLLEDWAAHNKGILLGKIKWKDDVIDSNEYLMMFQIHQVANAAELLRDYNKWGESENFANVVNWLVTYWYPFCHRFLELNVGDHWWMNWDLASMTAILSIGILAEDNDMVNEAILRFKCGEGPGSFTGKGIIDIFDDPDGSGEKLAQGNEAGRDQGHNTLCAVLVGYFCQMALNIGEDLFAFNDGVAIAFAQYAAKYNLPKDGDSEPGNADDSWFKYSSKNVPFTAYSYNGGSMTELGSGGRGTNRPGWDIWASYCKTHGIQGKYVTEYAERYRPDGGGGHYGGNSGGFDQLGFSTLMYHRE